MHPSEHPTELISRAAVQRQFAPTQAMPAVVRSKRKLCLSVTPFLYVLVAVLIAGVFLLGLLG